MQSLLLCKMSGSKHIKIFKYCKDLSWPQMVRLRNVQMSLLSRPVSRVYSLFKVTLVLLSPPPPHFLSFPVPSLLPFFLLDCLSFFIFLLPFLFLFLSIY